MHECYMPASIFNAAPKFSKIVAHAPILCCCLVIRCINNSFFFKRWYRLPPKIPVGDIIYYDPSIRIYTDD